MKYTVKAIETNYGGVVFRSRLEAKWAAMFDCLGWAWQYEPFDLEGWSPDFHLHIERPKTGGGVREIDLLVEVKPFVTVEQFEGHQISQWDLGHPLFCDHGWPGTTLNPACAGFGAGPDVVWLQMFSDSGDSFGSVHFDCLLDEHFVPEWKVGVLWKQVSNDVRWLFNDHGARLDRAEPGPSDLDVKHTPLTITWREPPLIRRKGSR